MRFDRQGTGKTGGQNNKKLVNMEVNKAKTAGTQGNKDNLAKTAEWSRAQTQYTGEQNTVETNQGNHSGGKNEQRQKSQPTANNTACTN